MTTRMNRFKRQSWISKKAYKAKVYVKTLKILFSSKYTVAMLALMALAHRNRSEEQIAIDILMTRHTKWRKNNNSRVKNNQRVIWSKTSIFDITAL